jgi:uncharacterized protein with gpF-like domain
MAQQPPQDQKKVLPPIVPSAGVAAVYRSKLTKSVDRMNNSLDYWLGVRWEEDPVAAGRVLATMKELGHRWQSHFDELAPDVAGQWGGRAEKHTTNRIKQLLDDAGWTVEFKVSPQVQAIMDSAVQENVGLIRSIAAEHLQRVEGIVMRNVQKGSDLRTMTRELHEQFDVPLKRAAFIARDQNSKMGSAITRARQMQAGIKRARWMHSNVTAPGHFRPEHLSFSRGEHSPGAKGPIYIVADGAYLEGRWTHPGFEINCRCTSRIILEGFE